MEIVLHISFVILSLSFVYISKFLTQACLDEKGDKKQLLLIAKISSILLAISCGIYLESYIFIILMLIYAISLFMSKLEKNDYISRIIFYVSCLITIVIQPILLFNLCLIEFFNRTFKRYSIKYELILNSIFSIIYLIILIILF